MRQNVREITVILWQIGLSFLYPVKNSHTGIFKFCIDCSSIPWWVVALRQILARCQHVNRVCSVDCNDLLVYRCQPLQLIGRLPWRHRAVSMTTDQRRLHQKPIDAACRCWLVGIGMESRTSLFASSPARDRSCVTDLVRRHVFNKQMRQDLITVIFSKA